MKRPTFKELLEKGEKQRELGLSIRTAPFDTTQMAHTFHRVSFGKREAPALRIVAQSCPCGVPMRKCDCGSWVCDAPGHARHQCEVLP